MRTFGMVSVALLTAAISGCGFGENADGFAPAIIITSPAETEISAIVNFSANAIDETGIAVVTFLVDGAVVAEDFEEPYTTPLNTILLTDGAHILQARAEDLSGNTASASKTVTVNNTKN